MYTKPITTTSDILYQGDDSLAQWLGHWISTPAIFVRTQSGTWDFFFQTMHHLFVTNFHIRTRVFYIEVQSAIIFNHFILTKEDLRLVYMFSSD